MIEFILAFVLLNHLDQVAPEFVGSFKDSAGCQVQATLLNASHPIMRQPGAEAAGAKFVCFKLMSDA